MQKHPSKEDCEENPQDKMPVKATYHGWHAPEMGSRWRAAGGWRAQERGFRGVAFAG